MKITILTDEKSWINEYVNPFLNYLALNNHEYSLRHELSGSFNGDLCICLSYSKLLSEEDLSKFKNVLVVHESELPKGKGWSPLSWQILEGNNKFIFTLFEASKKIDDGKIYLQKEVVLNGYELFDDWRKVQAETSFELCIEWIEGYPDILTKAIKQEGNETFYKKRNKKDSELDPTKSIKEQFNLLRIVDNENYPAFFKLNSKKYVLKIFLDEE